MFLTEKEDLREISPLLALKNNCKKYLRGKEMPTRSLFFSF